MTETIREIEVLPYDPAWKDLFERESEDIKGAIKEGLVRIHHIGSTSVPSLAAKPTIDIMPEVSSVELLDKFDSEMKNLGYIPKGEFGIPGRRFYLKGLINRTHHIHAFESGSEGLLRHLAVRDYLRSHESEAKEYANLKLKLAKEYKFDNDGYCEGKFEFVQSLEKRALEWTARANNSCHTTSYKAL